MWKSGFSKNENVLENVIYLQVLFKELEIFCRLKVIALGEVNGILIAVHSLLQRIFITKKTIKDLFMLQYLIC